MSENSSQLGGKVIHTKFSSDSIKTISDAKISTGAYGDLKPSQNLTHMEKEFKAKNGNHKLHRRHCKAKEYRRKKFYKCKNKRALHHNNQTSCPHVLKAKVCKTSPSLQPKSMLVSEATINSHCKSDEVNLSVKASRGWKLRKVLNKLRCFSTKIVSDSNFSQIKLWKNSSEKVDSSSNDLNFSCHSWSNKRLIQKLSWRKNGTESSIDAVTDQSSKSVNRANSSNCTTTCANDTDDDRKIKTLHAVHPVQEVDLSKGIKSTETIGNSSFIQNGSAGQNSEKSISVTIINLSDNHNSSLESTKFTKSNFKNLCFSAAKLKHLKSAPALIRNLSCINKSFMEAPADKETTKVMIVVDKTCQTQMSQILNADKVTTSTSCANIEICAMHSDKEIQNELSSFSALNTSVNKMCQTSQSVGSLLKDESKENDIRICCKKTCAETLSEVSQLASELIEIATQEQKSTVKTLGEQNEDNLPKSLGVDKKYFYSPKSISPIVQHHISHKCSCYKDCKQSEDDSMYQKNENENERVRGKRVVNENVVPNLEFQSHLQETVFIAGREDSCKKNSPRTPLSPHNSSNPELKNKKASHSIGFIQQPSILKSSLSFLKVDDCLPNPPNCFTCNIHKNTEVWKTKDPCCHDIPLTRSNFLKLYPEPYINYLSSGISNVQLIFHKKNKNQKQLYVCQECKKNASWNRHTRKHYLSPKRQKSTSTCDSQTPSWILDDSYSSADTYSRRSVESCTYRHKKNKQLQRKKIKLKSHSRYESSDKGQRISKDQRRMKYEDDCLDVLVPPPPSSPITSQQTATEVILPPPPPPLYQYPPLRYNPGEYSETYPQGKRLSSNKRNKSPEYERPSVNKPLNKVTNEKRHHYNREDVPLYKQPQGSPPFLRKYRSPKRSSPKRLSPKYLSPKRKSSESENSDIIIIPNDKRYEKEKTAVGYFSYNNPSNCLLKYPGFGDCIPTRPLVKLKPKTSPTTHETKIRKKIKDKYRRDGTSVRCLIRDALTTEGTNGYRNKNSIAEKSKHISLKDALKIESNRKITTLYENNLNAFPSKPVQDTTKTITDMKKHVNKYGKVGAVQFSKNALCVLSDSVATSDSEIKVFDCRKTVKRSESTQLLKPRHMTKEQKVMKRYSEEYICQRTISTVKKHGREKEMHELFRNSSVKTPSSTKALPKLSDDLSTSDESIIQYFRIMDVVAEKRRQFKKEERRRLKIQELKQNQTKLC